MHRTIQLTDTHTYNTVHTIYIPLITKLGYVNATNFRHKRHMAGYYKNMTVRFLHTDIPAMT